MFRAYTICRPGHRGIRYVYASWRGTAYPRLYRAYYCCNQALISYDDVGNEPWRIARYGPIRRTAGFRDGDTFTGRQPDGGKSG